jgi:hypothetical protein
MDFKSKWFLQIIIKHSKGCIRQHDNHCPTNEISQFSNELTNNRNGKLNSITRFAANCQQLN